MKVQRRLIFRPVRRTIQQSDGGFVIMFGLPGHITDRLVEQDRYALLLGILCGGAQGDFLGLIDLAAQFADGFAIDFHPAFFDIAIRFAARTQAEFGHAFGEADLFHDVRYS